MRKGIFYIVVAFLSIGIIILNTNNEVKYTVCEDPNDYIAIIDEITNETITISVDRFTSGETYSDYVYHIEDSVLYVGVKFTLNPLNSNATGSHTFTIELEEPITKVVLKGGIKEQLIYPE